MVGTLVPGPIRHQVIWHCPPSDLRMDDDPPAWKAARAVASAVSPDVAAVSSAPTSPLPLAPAHSRLDRSATRDESLPAETSTGVSVTQYGAPPAPVVGPVPSDRWRPTLPVLLLLPRFATQDFTPDPDTAQSHLVATQLYPASPGSRLSTPCFDLAEFDSETSRTAPVLQYLMLCQCA